MYRYPEPLTSEALETLMRDRLYTNPFHPEHEPYARFVREGFERLYPDPARHDAIGRMIDAPAAARGAGGPGTVHVRAYAQSRDGQSVPVSAHERSAPGTGIDAPTGDSSGLPPMRNPVPGGKIRQRDGYGSGHFGADREYGPHRGLDIVVEPCRSIQSPVTGTVVRTDIDPYGDRIYKGVSIRTDDGHDV